VERESGGVANESSVASVVIFEVGAIRVGITITGNLDTFALRVNALVAQGARVPIVTSVVVGDVLATTVFHANVLGARILIFAYYRVAGTDPGSAMICDGARVAVHAFASIEGYKFATFLTVAQVVGTLVFVVAGQP